MSNIAENSSVLAPTTHMGLVALTVSRLSTLSDFYTQGLGFTLLKQTGDTAVLGVGDEPLLVLKELPDALPRPARTTGLYHVAFRVPTRVALGKVLRHLLTIGYAIDGASDHLVSEAIYLSDPDGNGLEIYRDRSRETWIWLGTQVQMASDPLDFEGILAEGDRDATPWSGLAEGTDLGHMHLQVAELARAEEFYCKLLGFTLVNRMPGAFFVSAGGYHHHIGLNIWQSRNAGRAPANATGLRLFTIVLPDEATAHQEVIARLQKAAYPFTKQDDLLTVHDPWGNFILLTTRTRLTAEDILALVSSGTQLPA